MQIRVKIQDVSESDALKLKKIFQLSVNRNKQYILVEEKADLLINANPDYQRAGEIPILTLGSVKNFPDSKTHIKPPLLAIRLLKILDAVDIPPLPTVKEMGSETERNLIPELFSESKGNIIYTPGTITTEPQNTYDILVVDDSVLIHKALELELEKADFASNITFVESGEQCLDASKDKKIDLIFLDVMMPGIDGYETCTELRKNPLFKKTPIIMLSSKTSPLDEVKGVMAGCTTYLTKPIEHKDFQKLLIRMDKWLENFSPA